MPEGSVATKLNPELKSLASSDAFCPMSPSRSMSLSKGFRPDILMSVCRDHANPNSRSSVSLISAIRHSITTCLGMVSSFWIVSSINA